MKSRYSEWVAIVRDDKLTLKCLVCNHEWTPEGRLYKWNWMCPKGCTEKKLKQLKRNDV